MDTPKEHFIKTWGIGYAEDFAGYPDLDLSAFIKVTLAPFYNRNHVALEIGCGRGAWTRRLSQNFRKVICLDVIPESDWIQELPNVEYIELPDRSFSCPAVDDDTIDFAWSYGCFCHLSMDAVREYLNSLFQKMKRGADVVIMFANWPRNAACKDYDRATVYPPELCPWFYQDVEMVQQAVAQAGFVDFRDMIPDFRDTIAHFKKPH